MISQLPKNFWEAFSLKLGLSNEQSKTLKNFHLIKWSHIEVFYDVENSKGKEKVVTKVSATIKNESLSASELKVIKSSESNLYKDLGLSLAVHGKRKIVLSDTVGTDNVNDLAEITMISSALVFKFANLKDGAL